MEPLIDVSSVGDGKFNTLALVFHKGASIYWQKPRYRIEYSLESLPDVGKLWLDRRAVVLHEVVQLQHRLVYLIARVDPRGLLNADVHCTGSIHVHLCTSTALRTLITYLTPVNEKENWIFGIVLVQVCFFSLFRFYGAS